MKSYLVVFSLLCVFGCKTSDKPVSVTKEIPASEFQETVNFLASDALEGRNTGSIGIDKAATFIENTMKTNGLQPYFETYRDLFEFEDKRAARAGEDPATLKAFNIVGVVEGSDPELKKEYIILGAHYDHIGIFKAVSGDSIANGANDNAAGTSAVLALAKCFAKSKTNKRSLMFALFSAEEKGLLGSKHLAEKLKSENFNLYTMVNFEMIGVPMKTSDYVAYITGFEASNMAEKINEYAGLKLVGFLPKAQEYSLFSRSDNYPFYQQFQLPAQTVSTFDFTNYEFYHNVEDESSSMDYDHMASFVNQMVPVIETMSNTPTKDIKMHED